MGITREMMDAINGSDADRDTFVNREALRHAVSRAIMCQVTGRVLDVRTAVLFTATDAAGKSAARCVDGAVWDGMAESLTARCAELGATLEVIDGRTLAKASRARG